MNYPRRKVNCSEGANRWLGECRLMYDDVRVIQGAMSHSREDAGVVEVVAEVWESGYSWATGSPRQWIQTFLAI